MRYEIRHSRGGESRAQAGKGMTEPKARGFSPIYKVEFFL